MVAALQDSNMLHAEGRSAAANMRGSFSLSLFPSATNGAHCTGTTANSSAAGRQQQSGGQRVPFIAAWAPNAMSNALAGHVAP